MKKSLFLLLSICYLSVNAQNSYLVNTAGNTFSPDSLTINVGDTVSWNNTGGFHNVNATQVTFPNNPEGFGNAVAGAGWSFQWIFTIAGNYDYQCDPHAGMGMTGVIIANALPQTLTYVPDDNFEQALINLGYDTFLDDSVTTANIDTVTILDVIGDSISDLTGIESFTALTVLDCSYNALASLDVSNNTALTLLRCESNQLTSLDVRNGNNNLLVTNFYSTNNPNLYCVDVDDVAWADTNWTVTNGNIDSTMSFSSNCSLLQAENLFFSEYGEGSSTSNRYFEIYNPSSDTVDLTHYAFPKVNNTPNNGVGIYETWIDFDSAALILPYDVYVVCSPLADSLILIEADMEINFLSNGDDGFALVYGNNPGTPMSPSAGGYQILDWIGDWNGDPGQGWEVAGVFNGTRDHTLIRKCDVIQGDTSWTDAAGTNPVNSQWIVLANEDWSDIGQHIILPCNLIYGCMDYLACNYDSNVVIDDGSCIYPGQTYQYNISICNGDSALIAGVYYSQAGLFIDSLINNIGCDSIVHTNLIIYSQFSSIYGGIANNSIGGGNFFSGQQALELSCYFPSELISTVVYSADTTLTTFEIRDDNGNVLDDTTVNVVPGGYRVYFNFPLLAGKDYLLGIDGTSNNLYRNNSGVNYPYNFGQLAAVTSSTAGGQYYYFFYDIELRQSSQPTNYTICNGESIEIAGNLYDSTGLYIDSLISFLGCDSLVFTNLIVSPNVTIINNQSICEGDNYTVNGNVYDSTGTYIDSLLTINGCDSIVTLNLTVINNLSSSSIDSHIACEMFTWIDGVTYTSSNNTALYVLNNSAGCDSVITLNLIINNNLVVNISSLNNNLVASVSGGTSPYSYLWTGPINSSNAIITPLLSGDYCLEVTDVEGCVSSQVCENVTISAVNEISVSNDLIIYPNPVINKVSFKFNDEVIDIKVFNMLGELIVEQKIDEGQSFVNFSVLKWKAATYSVKIQAKNGLILQKKFNVIK